MAVCFLPLIHEFTRAGAVAAANTLPSAFGVCVNVSSEADVQRCVDLTVQRFGCLDILICNGTCDCICSKRWYACCMIICKMVYICLLQPVFNTYPPLSLSTTKHGRVSWMFMLVVHFYSLVPL